MARHRSRSSQYFSRRPSRGVRGRRVGHGPTRKQRKSRAYREGEKHIRERTEELLVDKARWAAVTAPINIYAGGQIRRGLLATTNVELMRRPGKVLARSVAYPGVVRRAIGRKAAKRVGLAMGLKVGVRVAGHFAGPFAIAFWAYDIYTIGKWISER